MPTIGFPLLLVPLAIYNIFVFLMPGVAFTAPILTVRLISGTAWSVTFGDALLALAAALLWFEVVKAARPGAKYLTDHLLSLLALGGAVAEFVLLAPFGTSTFFLLTVLMAVDFLAGVSIAWRTRKYTSGPQAVDDLAPVPHGVTLDRPIADAPAGAWGPEPLKREPVSEPRVREFPPMPAAPPIDVVPPVENNAPAEPDPQPLARMISDWKASDLVKDANSEDNEKPSSEKP